MISDSMAACHSSLASLQDDRGQHRLFTCRHPEQVERLRKPFDVEIDRIVGGIREAGHKILLVKRLRTDAQLQLFPPVIIEAAFGPHAIEERQVWILVMAWPKRKMPAPRASAVQSM
jgi:hypothetical protein